MKVTTKPDKSAAAITTNLTLVYDDPQTERALAQSAAIVRVQAHWRKNGIPAEATVKMSDLKAGLRGETDPLAIAKTIVTGHGGTITAGRSALGGLCICIVLTLEH